MDSKVKVSKSENGSVLNISENNPEYGWVLLQQVRTIVDDNGFLRRKPVSAVLPGNIEDMKAMNFYGDQEMPGKILIKESLIPFNAKNPDRDLKIAGDTGIVCRLEGLPIYRKTYYSTKANVDDIFVQHDNKEEIKGVYNNSIKSNTEALQKAASEDFDI